MGNVRFFILSQQHGVAIAMNEQQSIVIFPQGFMRESKT
jgi:hypothetical protein